MHSGPEANRHFFDVHPSERDLCETYLPAFRALVQEGNVDLRDGAYNRVNGESASASPRLLQQILRKDWGFKGYVVSGLRLYRGHLQSAQDRAARLRKPRRWACKSGCDLNCGTTYDALGQRRTQGLVTEAEIDVAVRRLMLTRFQLGMFDPPERVTVGADSVQSQSIAEA